MSEHTHICYAYIVFHTFYNMLDMYIKDIFWKDNPQSAEGSVCHISYAAFLISFTSIVHSLLWAIKSSLSHQTIDRVIS